MKLSVGQQIFKLSIGTNLWSIEEGLLYIVDTYYMAEHNMNVYTLVNMDAKISHRFVREDNIFDNDQKAFAEMNRRNLEILRFRRHENGL